MCYRVQVNTGVEKIAQRFKVTVEKPEKLLFDSEINGFAYQPLPVITSENPSVVTSEYSWGLIPAWCKDNTIRKNTLNAKIETLEDKPAFRNAVGNRCLVIATGYYEWRWLDEKGKVKEKYEIYSTEEAIFAFAGIYSTWIDPLTQEEYKTFSIITTQANPQMEYIHNMKKRMPVMLKKQDEMKWLDPNSDYSEFAFPRYNADIIAFNNK